MKAVWFGLFTLILLSSGFARAQTVEPTTTGLAYGQTATGALNNTTPRALYAFDGLRGETVEISLTVTGGDLDPMLMVMSASGDVLVKLDDNPAGRSLRVQTLRLPYNDRYLITVGRFGYSMGITSGDYSLTVDRVGVSSANGSALRYGDTIINEVNNSAPALYYLFRGEPGDILQVEMRRISGSLDPFLQVVDSDGFVLAENDDLPGSGSLDAKIETLVIEREGDYLIIASRFGGAAGQSTGGFYLSLIETEESGIGNSAVGALPLMLGTTIEDEINDEQPRRFFRFDAQTNDLLTFRMERLTGGLDSFLTLRDASGTELVSNDDMEGSQNALIRRFLVPADGTYTLIATRFEGDDGTTSGRFRLTSEREGNLTQDLPADVRMLEYGTTITGRIDDTTPQVRYAFFGQQGERVTISATRSDGDLDPVLRLLDASQSGLVTNDDIEGSQNARIEQYLLPTTGLYYIEVARFSGEGTLTTRGNFLLVLARRADG